MGLSFAVYSGSDQFRRQFVAQDAVADLLWVDTHLAQFKLANDHKAVSHLATPGARCRVILDNEELFRGRVARTPGVDSRRAGYVEFHVESDHRKLKDWHVWPKSAAAITAQDVEFARFTGTPEKILKDALTATATRLGVPWTAATNLNRGGAARRASYRFHSIAELAFPLLKIGRLGLVLEYLDGGAVRLDVREPDTILGRLDVATGVVDELDFDRWAPAATRVVVGGPGDGPDRVLYAKIDTARETAWSDIIEIFRDAHSAEEGDDLEVDADEALAEGAPGATVSMNLTETKRFRFRQHYQLGDELPFKIGATPGSEVISRITITDRVGQGPLVSPFIGDVAIDPLAKLGKRIVELKKRVRDLGRR